LRVITLTTDFGYKDPYVAEMKAVILSINPNVTLVDISHEVKRHDIYHAAYLLLTSCKYFPLGAIHVVVVDPGVGGLRKSIVIRTRRFTFIGPDNGVLFPAAVEDGILEIREIRNPILLRRKVTSTFHGRDIFAPIAAYLSLGIDVKHVGPRLSIGEVRKLYLPKAIVIDDNTICANIIHIDNFGNVITNVKERQFADFLGKASFIEISTKSARFVVPVVKTYSEVEEGSLLALINSEGFLEISVNKGAASEVLNVKRGGKIYIRRKYDSAF